MNIRGWEWLIILVIILLLFGPGRLGKVAGELGRSIREFRSGLKERSEEEETGGAEGEKSSEESESS
ncbi:MAG: twin-arginine translocase TatA/TatE family subunit [Anaerolineales bacterium]|jgi:sec-independent protein translocase protein TatA